MNDMIELIILNIKYKNDLLFYQKSTCSKHLCKYSIVFIKYCGQLIKDIKKPSNKKMGFSYFQLGNPSLQEGNPIRDFLNLS